MKYFRVSKGVRVFAVQLLILYILLYHISTLKFLHLNGLSVSNFLKISLQKFPFTNKYMFLKNV